MGSSTERAFESAMRALETPAEGREGSEPGGGQPASQFSAGECFKGLLSNIFSIIYFILYRSKCFCALFFT